jgi:transposase
MSNFRLIDRDTGFLMPPSVDEWLPERHLARFVVEVIGSLDLRAMTGSYRGSGEASYHPELLLGIIVYGYATGVFSSRKLERATYDSVALRFVSANQHPDHDTIAAFRRRFLPQIEALFVQVLRMAREMGVLKLGTVALDGTKIHANASRHSALSYDHIGKIETQLKAEVADLMARAEASDQADVPDGMSVPEELARREARLAAIAAAKAKIEARAKERYKHEQADYEANVNASAAAGMDPVIAMGREAHHPSLAERFDPAPEPPKDPTPLEAMAHRLQTPAGKKLYALRKQTPEPVFGIIKSVLGFRQFLLRGLNQVRGEWSLVTMTWNIKRMFALAAAG